MNYEGTVYVFDLDDTLVWSPHWYDEAVLDEGGYVMAPGRSSALQASLELIEMAKTRNIPENLKGMKLQAEESAQPDGRDVYFLLVDSNATPLSKNDLEGYFSDEELEGAHIESSSRFTPNLAIVDDYEYYLNLDTVGEIGFNKEMVKLYEQNEDNAVVLTARENVPGMNEKIHEVLTKKLKAPKAIFTRPSDAKNPGKYKGEIIAGIAAQPSVDFVHFYDDNLYYLNGAAHVIRKAGLQDKVQLHHVNVSSKPLSASHTIARMIKMANNLDEEGMHELASLADKIMGEASRLIK